MNDINIHFSKEKNLLFVIKNNKLYPVHPKHTNDFINSHKNSLKIQNINLQDFLIDETFITNFNDINTTLIPGPPGPPGVSFNPKIVTQRNLHELSQFEKTSLGEGYSWFNTNDMKLYFLKKNDDGLFFFSEGQNLVGLPGQPGEKGNPGPKGEKGDTGPRGLQGPALNIDFVFHEPIENLSPLPPNKFVFCSYDGKIYCTQENGISPGYDFIGLEGEKGEPGHIEAKNKLTRLILNKQVMLKNSVDFDRGRLVCDVFVDGKNLADFFR